MFHEFISKIKPQDNERNNTQSSNWLSEAFWLNRICQKDFREAGDVVHIEINSMQEGGCDGWTAHTADQHPGDRVLTPGLLLLSSLFSDRMIKWGQHNCWIRLGQHNCWIRWGQHNCWIRWGQDNCWIRWGQDNCWIRLGQHNFLGTFMQHNYLSEICLAKVFGKKLT